MQLLHSVLPLPVQRLPMFGSNLMEIRGLPSQALHQTPLRQTLYRIRRLTKS